MVKIIKNKIIYKNMKKEKKKNQSDLKNIKIPFKFN